MYTTEQLQAREDKFIELMEAMADELYEKDINESVDENYELTFEEAEIAEIMMEYFVDNYKMYSLKEAAIVSMTGVDPNKELIEAYIQLALDETVGGFVAGAVHGISKYMAGRNAKKAQAAHKSATKNSQTLRTKASAAHKAIKGTSGFRATLKKGKAASLDSRHDKAVSHEVSAANKSKAASDASAAATKKHADLKAKIDTGIHNLKTKVKDTAHKAAHRVAYAAGRVAGSLA